MQRIVVFGLFCFLGFNLITGGYAAGHIGEFLGLQFLISRCRGFMDCRLETKNRLERKDQTQTREQRLDIDNRLDNIDQRLDIDYRVETREYRQGVKTRHILESRGQAQTRDL